jgi:lantibiotic modifying enzyme
MSRLTRGIVLLGTFAAFTLRPAASQRPNLDAAVDVAKWIQASTLMADGGVTWPADPSDPKSVNYALYSGSPGVVLFLLELHKATGQPNYLAQAREGAGALIARLPLEKESGLYTGIAGIGFTLGEMFRATGDDRYREGVRTTIKLLTERAQPAGKGIQWSDVTDIIGGGAGTGLFLLYAADLLKIEEPKGLAAKAADRLLELGTPAEDGLQWAMDPKFPRKMPNFSHGTAGISYFLAGTYKATGDRKYLDGALAGARFLKAIAKTEGDVCLIRHNEPDGMDLFYLGWCHGPVGTSRLWYQLARVTNDKTWMDWVFKSARALQASGIPESRTPGFWNNVSQCCGSAGVAQFFLDLYGVTKDGAYLQFSKKMSADLLMRGTRDEQGLRWVQAEHRVRPELLIAQTGYMQGAAGIGMWLLRLDAAEQKRSAFVKFPDSPW